LKKWLKASYKKGKEFEELGNVVPHGVQIDGVSCIPVSINTISHGIFGDLLWTPKARDADRIEWFMKLVPRTQVSLSANYVNKDDC